MTSFPFYRWLLGIRELSCFTQNHKTWMAEPGLHLKAWPLFLLLKSKEKWKWPLSDLGISFLVMGKEKANVALLRLMLPEEPSGISSHKNSWQICKWLDPGLWAVPKCNLGFPGGSVVKNLPTNAEDRGDAGSNPGLGRSPGVGNGNSRQYSCLEDPMDRGWPQYIGSQRVGYHWARTLECMNEQMQPH